jgi:small GTP-binding protein
VNNRRNVGIFAHVDAGKTTTTEHMLYISGKIRSIGSVDAGTTQTDWLDVERERGISVRAAATSFEWRGFTVNLVDTPGHVDFLSEVERSMRVLDGAVLIVSAVEGVQAQTEVLWHALRELRIPTLIYINKIDRVGADITSVMADIKKQLSKRIVPIEVPQAVEDTYIGSLSVFADESKSDGMDQLIEAIAELDEEVLEQYLGGETINGSILRVKLAKLVREAELFPVVFGASSKGIGVEALMDAITAYLPPPSGVVNAPPSGVVFKIERDKSMGRVAFVRLYQGTLRNRDGIRIGSSDIEEKITQIRKISGSKYEDTGELIAGDIGAVFGLASARIGDILGDSGPIPKAAKLAVPLLTVQVEAMDGHDYPALVAALQELSDEDPLLNLQWLQEERDLHIRVMGPIQLEVLTSVLRTRFGLQARFGDPSIIYKETPRKTGEGFIAYTMPKPCWAILRFHIQPGERGSGLRYHSIVRGEKLMPAYQNEVERRVPEALQQGLLGWEVTDLIITLVEGEHHVWHTHPLDFVVATPMGIMNGLAHTGTQLLEPMLRFRIAAPEEYGGRIMSDLAQMRAEFDSPILSGGRMVIEGVLPAATSLDYSVRLGAATGGRGSLTTYFDGYRACPPDVYEERPRRGVNPLDQAKFILAARKAL